MLNRDKLNNIFNAFNDQRILVIGDVMIDAYIWGSVTRISPEAPVPIVTVTKRENRLGGAANVALNIQSLGATPILCSVIGNDDKSKLFMELMDKQGLSTEGIVTSDNRITTTKTRVIGNNHQMLRVDSELDSELDNNDSGILANRIIDILEADKIGAIVFEDYNKGTISPTLISRVVEKANEKNIPSAVDPKKKHFAEYRNVTLFKPNLKELQEGLNIELNVNKMDDVKRAAKDLQTKLNSKLIMVTLSDKGVYIFGESADELIPAHVRDISDVSGAGDTVISVATLCLAQQCSPVVTATLSNLAGGLVCEKVGVVPVDRERLFEETLKLYTEA